MRLIFSVILTIILVFSGVIGIPLFIKYEVMVSKAEELATLNNTAYHCKLLGGCFVKVNNVWLDYNNAEAKYLVKSLGE